MRMVIVLFFAMFFGFSTTSLVLEFKKLYTKKTVQKQELYPDGDCIFKEGITQHPKKTEMTEKDFQTYKNETMALELP